MRRRAQWGVPGAPGVVQGALMLGLALVLTVTGVAPAQALRLGEPAPEVTGGPWINSAPLTMAGLRGRVVLVEFWTYG